MLGILTDCISILGPARADRLTGLMVRIPLPVWRRRRGGFESSVARVLSPELRSPFSTRLLERWGREAVRRHLLFLYEFLSEMGGHRHRVEDGGGLAKPGLVGGDAQPRPLRQGDLPRPVARTLAGRRVVDDPEVLGASGHGLTLGPRRSLGRA